MQLNWKMFFWVLDQVCPWIFERPRDLSPRQFFLTICTIWWWMDKPHSKIWVLQPFSRNCDNLLRIHCIGHCDKLKIKQNFYYWAARLAKVSRAPFSRFNLVDVTGVKPWRMQLFFCNNLSEVMVQISTTLV